MDCCIYISVHSEKTGKYVNIFAFFSGYEGANCEVDFDECAEQPCQNGGECFERSDPSHWEQDWELRFSDAAGYICQCQGGFAGWQRMNEKLSDLSHFRSDGADSDVFLHFRRKLFHQYR